MLADRAVCLKEKKNIVPSESLVRGSQTCSEFYKCSQAPFDASWAFETQASFKRCE